MKNEKGSSGCKHNDMFVPVGRRAEGRQVESD